ncbi:MAG: FAD-linked oxidase C-terminal domain-containing protein [Desulfobacterales bacterium]|jgi:glycolate oxidase|nr:FAD-linked oxidase C-terminal domain-containing protein [Desulfobacterales bacterium]
MPLENRIYAQLQHCVGSAHCTREKEDLACYAYDATRQMHLPDAVIFPGSTGEVAAILRLANEANFPVIPRGSGSGTTGGALPVNGGVVLVTTRLNKILHIDTDNLVAHVEPGVLTGHLHTEVEKLGLYYPPDPSSAEFSTLGGNLGECAGGPRAVKYGVTRDYVLGLEAVIGTGEIIHAGVQTTKGVVGYDLTRLMVGSEGTLGVITRMALRLIPKPESVRTLKVVFERIETAAETVSEIIRSGLVPRAIEYMDNASIRCAETYLKIGLPTTAGALLIIEVDGRNEETARDIQALKTLCDARGALEAVIAQNEQEAKNLWRARKALSPAMYLYGPDKINEDIVVPRSKIPDMVRKIEALKKETGLTMASFGHAGDGNIHFHIMLDKKVSRDALKAENAVSALFDYTLALGGTISGEHGVGTAKAPYFNREIGVVETRLMKKIKSAFDPRGVLNPGKIFS